jgi:hypothetical protein
MEWRLAIDRVGELASRHLHYWYWYAIHLQPFEVGPARRSDVV